MFCANPPLGPTCLGIPHRYFRKDSPVNSVMDTIASRTEGLCLLMHAYNCATDVKRDLWDFAVDIKTLRKAGLSDSDLRWLLCKGFAAAAREVTDRSAEKRTFEQTQLLHFSNKASFILTGIGYDALDDRIKASQDAQDTTIRPTWDTNLHQLTYDGCIVKHFRSPSPNQEAVLMQFNALLI